MVKLYNTLLQVYPQWQLLMAGKIGLTEFKTLCHDIDLLLVQIEGDSSTLRTHLTDILMAQDYQDLTGQIIRRVIELVHEVEDRLVEILKAFGMEQDANTVIDDKKDALKPEGPIINPEQRNDVVESQDDVDDLLSSLGF